VLASGVLSAQPVVDGHTLATHQDMSLEWDMFCAARDGNTKDVKRLLRGAKAVKPDDVKDDVLVREHAPPSAVNLSSLFLRWFFQASSLWCARSCV
jgi:hypothetical protein